MIFAFCLLGAFVVFLAIAVGLLYFQVVRPMRTQLAEQGETIKKNAGATVGLFMTNRREIVGMSNRVAFVEAYSVPVVPTVEEAPVTVRSERMKGGRT